MLVIGSAVALLLLFWEHRLLRLALTITLIVFFTIVVGTQSRGVAIGVAAGLVVFAFYATSGVHKLILLGALLFGIAVPILVPRDVLDRYFASTGSDDVVRKKGEDQRVSMAQSSTEQRSGCCRTDSEFARPYAGRVGIGSYAFANAQYDPLTGERDTHNTYVNLSAESGLPALLLFIGLIYLTIRPCHHAIISLRSSQPRHSMAIAGMLSALVALPGCRTVRQLCGRSCSCMCSWRSHSAFLKRCSLLSRGVVSSQTPTAPS